MFPRIALAVAFALAGTLSIGARPPRPPEGDLERRFTGTVRPFLETYCIACHGGQNPAAQLDLRTYSSMSAMARDFPRWTLALEKLTAKEMPPQVARQPSDEDRRAVIEWIAAMRTHEMRRNAGDPGVVLARRLSNAEYNYTIRDLTGADIRPAREFPVDPANPSGFDNSGESLAMSPELMTKYLQAARQVANHLVLKPTGVAFAPNPMLVETDRDKYAVGRIIDFYQRQPTDYADYFRTAWRYKHHAAPKPTLARFAAANGVSPKYLATIWRTLEGSSEEIGPIARLQRTWRELGTANLEPGTGNLEQRFARMREFVVEQRRKIELKHQELSVEGIRRDAQPFLMWRNRRYATHRTDYDRAALDVPADQRQRYEAAFARFSAVFPDAFYVSERGRYFPDNTRDKGRHLSAGFHNLMGYFRDDLPLYELILDEKGQKELDALWQELDFVASANVRTYVQFFLNESGEARGLGRESEGPRPADRDITSEAMINEVAGAYLARARASGNATAVKAVEDHFQSVNAGIRWVEKARIEAEATHLAALQEFAARAFRRPLSQAERAGLVAYYRSLREKADLNHEDAIRDSVVSVLMSPDFCYRIDLVDGGTGIRPLPDYALASRLSYFLWSSMPDAELMARAAAGDLDRPDVLAAQARRMLKDERARGLATEFGANWLDFRRFEEINTVDRGRFASFTNDVRQAMFEEPIHFMLDVIRQNRPVLDFVDANHTFVNPVLAKHYGMPDVEGSPNTWTRIDDANRYGRGGLLPMGAFLTKNAPGLRTSPVKRGYWVVKQVLGERIPPPPAQVPELPRDEAKLDLPLRDVLARHRQDKACATCHARFDSLGLAFEGYGPVGEQRSQDLAGHPIDASATFPGGSAGTGVDGLRAYIRAHRQNDFLDNLSRKLLAYALGRSLILSDDLTVEAMRARLARDGYRFHILVESIVTSPQFRNKRGADSQLTAAR
jgi:mono/diheme cytochrome c family protein